MSCSYYQIPDGDVRVAHGNGVVVLLADAMKNEKINKVLFAVPVTEPSGCPNSVNFGIYLFNA